MSHEKGADKQDAGREYYYLYIFFKNQCIYSIDLKNEEREKTSSPNKIEKEKLLLGSIYALNYLCFNIQPNKKLKNLYKSMHNINKNINHSLKTHNQNIANTQNNLHVGNFNSFNTPFYKLHYFETLTAYKFVIITHKSTPNLSGFLRDIYKTIFLDFIILNPLYNTGDEIRDKSFDEKILDRIRGLTPA
ncbi:trafficking protein particle complex subunit 1, putative [Plasmodium knowlesi strain H]|uniref:Trafficking protein particle complex subunit n=3 Tax=Plasmodium knowlesi TaxID=5850 RepID=A0A5K1VBP6_PLAKH|nr:trafficking protein particle complex subunit 1, putative [Plasmodium knowlesi strain H]OTN67779.1 Sybindin domain containing protein [Plasmodium knowlesi]CAA9990555.1 trafficking protein particle complex subunit 1, putative [Plasmodium knowlesi strain H]SBO19814.1 trafficking protein particle complex subunit 1, putative [Plasmodium knowlesi strain H]SBO22368.1 trafficking protein particle complex subunit 1, putative [Plasmodium knowlesi strain H]VVS80029.1 trafficking protein particle compl|eukprot:XP_002260940.1 sybindin domain containing protein [Plasmodium knowlesi strain H]